MRSMRRVLQVVLPVVVLALCWIATKALMEGRVKPVPVAPERVVPLVRTVEVRPTSVGLQVGAQGVVQPRTQTVLASEVAARVVEVAPALASGGFFDRGELLLALDGTDYAAAVAEAQARIARAETQLAQGLADAEVAAADWRTVGADGDPSPLVLREPQVAEARAELAAARAHLAKAERDVERTRVVAPYPGRVRERHVDVGQYVTVGTRLATVYAVDYAEVRLPVADDDLARLDLPLDASGRRDGARGPRVELRARFAGRDCTWIGHVVRVEGAVDERTRSIALVARVEDPYGRAEEGGQPPLLAGLFVDATIEGRTLERAFVVPREALRAGSRAFLLDAERRLAIRTVEVAQASRDEVVVSAGLEEGDALVVSPLELPIEGMQLRAEDPR